MTVVAVTSRVWKRLLGNFSRMGPSRRVPARQASPGSEQRFIVMARRASDIAEIRDLLASALVEHDPEALAAALRSLAPYRSFAVQA
jgi:hypothetical protein